MSDTPPSPDTIWQTLGRIPHTLSYRDIAGVRTRCLEAGSGRPVVLLHGTGGHLEAFVRNIGPLSRRYRVVAIDLAGHGFSESPPGFGYDWPGLAAHVLQALSALGLVRPVLVGEALGAQVAQWIAMHRPDALAAAVLACAVIPPVDVPVAGAPDGGSARFRELTTKALEHPSGAVMRERLEWLLQDPSVLSGEMINLRTAMWAPENVRAAQRELLASYAQAADREDLRVTRRDVARIGVPVLVIWSGDNPLQSVAVARAFAAGLEGRCQYVELDRSRLWPQYEEADRFNELVCRFVDTIDDRGAETRAHPRSKENG